MRFIALGVLAIALTNTGWSLCPEPAPRPCTLFFHSEAVFIGTVIHAHEQQGDKRHDDGVRYIIRVSKWFKGKLKRQAIVFTERNSGGEYLDIGKEYLIFASKGDKAHALVIGCRQTFTGEQQAIAIKELAALANAGPSGVISGGVYESSNLASPIAGVTGRITSPVAKFVFKTDKNGRFLQTVPAGAYRVKVNEGTKQKFEAYFISLDNPESIRISAGQCVDLAFVKR